MASASALAGGVAALGLLGPGHLDGTLVVLDHHGQEHRVERPARGPLQLAMSWPSIIPGMPECAEWSMPGIDSVPVEPVEVFEGAGSARPRPRPSASRSWS